MISWQTGSHGHTIVFLSAKDLFTGEAASEVVRPGSEEIEAPIVTRSPFTLVDVRGDGLATLIHQETGEIRDDLRLDTQGSSNELHATICAAFARTEGHLPVTVLSALGIDGIIANT